MRTGSRSVVFVAVLTLALVACGEDKETITEQVYPACSDTHPFGTCPDGEVCFDGACVTEDSLCSADNLEGTCPEGQTCFAGGCVPELVLCGESNLTGLCGPGLVCVEGECVEPEPPVTPEEPCGPARPDGPCPEGLTCLGGVCVAETALCDTANPDGVCPVGETCLEGTCVATASLCSGVNPTGDCPGARECVGGICTEPTVEPVDPCTVQVYETQPVLGTRTDTTLKDLIVVDGLQFKDLDGNGELTPYEDWRLLEICRAEDLVSRMTLDQKIGTMSEGSRVGSGSEDGSLDDRVTEAIVDLNERYALIRLGRYSPQQLAVFLNNVQELAEAQPLGVPVTITTDPSHGFGMSTDDETGEQSIRDSSVVSAWPYPLGLGAINDPVVTRQYGDTVREEFMAMGFRWQLGPMADIGTEPRWARVQNVFGSNPYHVAIHVAACVAGFQGVGDGGLTNGIAATMKHFPGAGANEDGMDSHSYVGRFNVYPGNNFVHHVIPFQAAVDQGVAAVMPCYSVYKGVRDYSPEQTGAAFSHGLMTVLLKDQLGFTGMVTGDWGALGDGYNTESLSRVERAAMWLRAGSHQLGSDRETIFREAYDQGVISEDEIDQAVVKIVEMTFKLGLFENPYVDPEAAATIVRSATNRENGFIAQKKAIVLLKNNAHEDTGRRATEFLPIDGSRFDDANENEVADPGEYICDTNGDGVIKVYYDGVIDGLVADTERPDAVTDIYGEYDYRTAATATALAIDETDDLADADYAVLRITARKGVYFGMDAGVPLSFDGPFPGEDNDGTIDSAIVDRNRVIDVLRARDGYVDADGNIVAAVNPDLRIVVIMHMDRPGIVEPFVKGLVTLDELPGEPGSYPLVSDPANTDPTGESGIDGFLVEFGAFDRAVLDFLFNVNPIEGWEYGQAILPMEIPSSDAEVEAQFEDLPNDTENPTFMLGDGMTY